jgi:hypothetical protein
MAVVLWEYRSQQKIWRKNAATHRSSLWKFIPTALRMALNRSPSTPSLGSSYGEILNPYGGSISVGVVYVGLVYVLGV